MRRFSEELVEEKEREFEIGGEMFKWRYPYWADFTARADEDQKMVDDGRAAEMTATERYQDFADRIETYLDPANDSVKRWRALTKRKVDPIPAYLLPELYVWLAGVTSDRPTGQPSPSENGQGLTEATSTEGLS